MVGLEIVGIVREEGVSGSVPLSLRPGGQEVIALQRQYKAAHIIALKLDRLFRDAEDALHQTRTWDKAGIALHLVDMGGQSVNTASAMGRMMLTMMAAFAELERNLIAERTTQALQHKKEHRQAYAPTPYGYSRDGAALVVVESEQATVLQIRAWRSEGLTLRQIVAQLNAAGIPTKRGGKWAAQTVKYILDNESLSRGPRSVSLTPLYTPQEVADLWKVTRRTVYEWIKTGKIKACKIGDTVRISESELLAFIRPVAQEQPRQRKLARKQSGRRKRPNKKG